jgi:hypothetical protein
MTLTVEQLRCPPRYGTAPNLDRRTIGHEIEAHHVLLHQGRHRFAQWQRYVSDVSGELDDNGLRRYLTCVVIVPRQQGKTTWVQAKLTHSTRRSPGRSAIYGAQHRDAAKYKLLDEFADGVLAVNPLYRNAYRPRRSNGSEHIRWIDAAAARSIILIIASNDKAGHSLTKVDDAVLDEAYAHRDLTIVNGVMPTLTHAEDPQLTVVSTVGEGDDGLLQHYQEIGQASLTDPDTTVAYFEWSADDDADRDDEAVWWQVMPGLGELVTVDRIRAMRESMAAAEFDRAYLCRRPRMVDTSDVDLEAFADCYRPDTVPARPIVLAVDLALDRSHATIAAAGPIEDRVAVAIERRPGTSWVVDELQRLVANGGIAAIYADRRAGCGGIIDTAAGRGLSIGDIQSADLVSHIGTTVDELAARRLEHTGHPALTEAVQAAKKRPLGDAFAWSKMATPVDIAPLNAMCLAVGASRRLFPMGRVDGRIT